MGAFVANGEGRAVWYSECCFLSKVMKELISWASGMAKLYSALQMAGQWSQIGNMVLNKGKSSESITIIFDVKQQEMDIIQQFSISYNSLICLSS